LRELSSATLVTGASGSLGWVLSRSLAKTREVIAAYNSNVCHPDGTKGVALNLEDVGAFTDLLERCVPRTIFHLAAITDPDRCERAPQEARRVNAEATQELARWAGATGAKVAFVSTDLVFDGTRGNYNEGDAPAPLCVYARTKLDAENAVLSLCPGALVIRGSLFYGIGGPVGRTFLSGLVDTLSCGSPMRLFTDQRRNPVLLEDLAGAMIRAVDLDLAGLLHIGGDEVVTRYEFGQAVCEVFGFDNSLLVPIRMADFEYEAARPLDSSLDIGRIRHAIGFRPTPLRRALREIKSRLA
jgi:dTDP-4-dehydrorhamnose reductase